MNAPVNLSKISKESRRSHVSERLENSRRVAGRSQVPSYACLFEDEVGEHVRSDAGPRSLPAQDASGQERVHGAHDLVLGNVEKPRDGCTNARVV